MRPSERGLLANVTTEEDRMTRDTIRVHAVLSAAVAIIVLAAGGLIVGRMVLAHMPEVRAAVRGGAPWTW